MHNMTFGSVIRQSVQLIHTVPSNTLSTVLKYMHISWEFADLYTVEFTVVCLNQELISYCYYSSCQQSL